MTLPPLHFLSVYFFFESRMKSFVMLQYALKGLKDNLDASYLRLQADRTSFGQGQELATQINTMQEDCEYLDIGGVCYHTRRQHLVESGDSMLSAIVCGEFRCEREDNGYLFIDRDGALFKDILLYLRHGQTNHHVDPMLHNAICREAKYYGLEGLTSIFQAASSPRQHYALMVAGGIDGTYRPVVSAEMYDPVAAEWQPIPHMRVRRACSGYSTLDSKFLLIGGKSFQHAESSVEEYNPIIQQWRDLPHLRVARRHCAAVTFGKSVVVIGGFSSSDSMYLNSVERYNPATSTWTPMPSLNTSRLGCAACVVDGRLIVAGGIGDEGILASIEEYQPATQTWTPLPDMLTARCFLAAVAVHGKLMMMGGKDMSMESTDLVEEFDPLTGQGQYIPSMNTKRCGCAAVCVEDAVLVLGGTDGHRHLNTVEQFDLRSRRWLQNIPGMLSDRSYAAVGLVPVPGPRDQAVAPGSELGGTAY